MEEGAIILELAVTKSGEEFADRGMSEGAAVNIAVHIGACLHHVKLVTIGAKLTVAKQIKKAKVFKRHRSFPRKVFSDQRQKGESKVSSHVSFKTKSN